MKNRLFLIVAFTISAVAQAQDRNDVEISVTQPKVEITLPKIKVTPPRVVVVNPQTRTCKHYECRKSNHCCLHHDNGKHKGQVKRYNHGHYDDEDHNQYKGHKKHKKNGHDD